MKSEWIRQFLSLAETRNFGLAAKKQGLSKATLSINLTKLEAHLNVSLINRDRAFRFLTPAGETLLRNANAMLADLESLEWGVNQPHLLNTQPLRVGYTSPAGESYLLPLLTQFLQEQPDCYPHFCKVESAEGEMQLVCGELDLLLLTGCVSQSSMIRFREETNPALAYYVGPTYRYAIVGTPVFQEYPWQALPFATALKVEHPQLGRVWDDQHYPRQLVAMCPSLSALIELCEQGECCAFLPTVCVQDQLDRGELVELGPAPFQLVCHPYLVCLPEAPEMVQRFLSLSQSSGFMLLKTKDVFLDGLRYPFS